MPQATDEKQQPEAIAKSNERPTTRARKDVQALRSARQPLQAKGLPRMVRMVMVYICEINCSLDSKAGASASLGQQHPLLTDLLVLLCFRARTIASELLVVSLQPLEAAPEL